MQEPPDNDVDKLIKKYASLAQLAGLFLIYREGKKTEEKIPLWAKWERFLLPAMIVIALGFIFKDIPETLGEIKDAVVKQNDRILVIETKLSGITADISEIKSNVRRNRESLINATQDRFTGVQAETLEKRMLKHTDQADSKIIDRINQSEQRLNLRIQNIQNEERNP